MTTNRRARTASQIRYISGGIAALVAGGLVLALEMWTVLAAPNLPTLTLATVMPELGPWAVAGCLIAGATAQIFARGWSRTAGVVAAAGALGLALVPWCLLPSTIAACDAEMREQFGTAVLTSPPALGGTELRQPYDVWTALAGYGASRVINVRRNLPVYTRDGAHLGLDIYTAGKARLQPTVILIYGGAWIFGSRDESAELARSLAQVGYTAIAIDYRHAPAYRFPTQINDVDDALATIARHAPDWNVDTKRVAIFGRSAGAQLALLAAYTRGPLTIRAAGGYYAPTDLVWGYRHPPRPDPANIRRILRMYFGGTPTDRIFAYIAGSPVTHIRPGLPPTLLISGNRDELVRFGFQTELRDALRHNRDRVAALALPWSNHAFDAIPNGTAGQLARYYTERFLAATL